MSYKKNRVFITGLGSVSTFGLGTNALWQGCKKGDTALENIPENWKAISPFSANVYSPLVKPDYDKLGLSRVEQLHYDTAVLNLFIAAAEAIEDANLIVESSSKKKNTFTFPTFNPYKLGIFIGSGNGGVNSLLENYRHFLLNKWVSENPSETNSELQSLLQVPKRFNKFVTARQMPNAVAAGLGIKYSVKGIVRSSHYACSSATVAIGEAFEAVQSGSIGLAIAGGTEYATDHLGSTFRSFDVANALGSTIDDVWHGPFDKRSNGFLFSEGGAGALIIESEESVTKRGIEPLAEIVSFKQSFDAYNIMAPEEGGHEFKRLFDLIFEDTDVNTENVDYINTHGTGTKNDINEANTINEKMPHNPVCNSSKSIFGHTLGASGALETIVTVKSLREQTIHKSGGLFDPVENINLCTETKNNPIKYALKISSAFGGHNAALLLKRI